MSFVGSNILAGASGQGGATDYAIQRSLRFNSGDSAYLSRQPSSASNRKTWTWSCWIKRNNLSSAQNIFVGSDNPTKNNTTFSAFYFHPDNNIHFGGWNSPYIITNAVYRDASAWYHIVLSVDTTQSTSTDRIKVYVNNELQSYSTGAGFPGQDTDLGINQAYPHYIGGNDPASGYASHMYADVHFIDGQALAPTDFGETDDNGVWQPKKFEGSYTYLFDKSQTWSNDITGSAQNSVTQAFDGKIYTWTAANNGSALTWTPSSTVSVSSSLRVYALRETSNDSITVNFTDGSSFNSFTADNTFRWQTIANASGKTISNITWNHSNSKARLSAIEVDGKILVDSGVTVPNNSFHLPFSDNSSNAALGTDTSGNSNTWTVNNLVAAPAGLATANQGFDVVTYTGNGGTQSVGGLAFQPDLIWCKTRSNAVDHKLVDSVRGLTNVLESNQTRSDTTGITNGITATSSTGFALGNSGDFNSNGRTYVAWCWKAGGAASSNTDGTITSQVSANNTYGFSIVSFENGSGTITVGHGLNGTPKFILTKSRDSSNNWQVYHASLGNSKKLYLDTTNAEISSSNWGNTDPTSTVFTLNDGTTDSWIAYCWSEVPGFSKISSYAGSNSSQTIECGFKPTFVMIKCTTSGNDWIIQDSARGTEVLYPNLANAEFGGNYVSFTSTGFTLNTGDGRSNSSGDTYIYAAYAAKPDGSVIDSLVDTPSNAATPTDTGAGGEVVGNYATLNPLAKSSGVTLSNGNLDASVGGDPSKVLSTIGMTSGKYYAEFTVSSGSINPGLATSATNLGSGFLGNDGGSWCYGSNGKKYHNDPGASGATYGATYTTGDVIGVAFDADGGNLTFYKNGTTQGVAYTGLTSGPYFFAAGGSSSSYATNFGQRAFAHAAPSGYKSLNTANLPEPTIADGSQYFDTKLYTGNQSVRSIPTSFSPDFVWIKDRTDTNGHNHNLLDIVRGAPKILLSDTTTTEITNSTDGFTSFNSDGFSLGANTLGTQSYELNKTGNNYVAWAWDGGTSTVTNNDGSITSQVRASAASGFSIATYTGTGANATFGHGLNAAPEMVIIKQRNGTGFWVVGHKDFPFTSDYYMSLNTSDALSTGAGGIAWQSTAPTSSVVSIGSSSVLNGSGNTHVAYCFAPVAGYSAIGSYQGNGNADGPFVYTGFKPAWILIRPVSGGNWAILDTARDPYNTAGRLLLPNDSSAEIDFTSSYPNDILSNGFKVRNTGGQTNTNGQEHVYLAFASNPFKTARAR